MTCLAALTAIAACGGGGGSSGGDAASTPPPTAPPSVPANPPALPTVIYQGRDASAVLNDANVGALGDAVFYAMVLGLDTATPSPRALKPGETNETVHGANGGTAQLLGRMNADGTGWYSATYLNYSDGETTLNGMLVDEILQVNDSGVWLSRRTSYHDYTVALGERAADYAGHMTLTRGTQGATASGTIRLRDVRGVEIMASGIAITIRGISGGFELAARGRVFDATHGYIDLTFAAPWVFASGGGFPAYGGPAIGTTADARALRLVSLTPDIVSLQYAASTPDRFDRGARLRWEALFANQTTRPGLSTPVADAGPSLSVEPGTQLTLEGGYSSHAETAFLRHEWTLLFRPPGSTATLSHANDVSPMITLDAPGRYLLQLVVSDEIRSSKRDFVAVAADPQVNSDPKVFSTAQLPPSTVATLGATVTLDGTLFTPRMLPLSSGVAPDIRVWGPHGDSVPTVQVGSSLTFVPNEPGIYKAMLGTTPTVVKGFDTQYFSVLTDLNFKPAVWVPTDDLVRNIVAADIDGDGRSDVVAGEDTQLEVFFGAAQPDFYGPVVLTGSFLGQLAAVGDLTGDGLADIAAPDFGGLAVFEQNRAGRSFQSHLLSNACGSPNSPVVIADINGDGNNDVAMGCYANIVYYLGRADGTLDSERTIAANTEIELVAGDLNGDGFDDLVVAKQHGPNIGVLLGQAGTAPQPIQWLTLVNQSHDRVPSLAVADVNADGRTDLLFGGRAWGSGNLDPDRLRVFHQNSGGQLVEAQVIDLPYPRRALNDISTGDFNHDGVVDIGLRTGAPTFLAHYQITPGIFVQQTRGALDCMNEASGDFNGDGLTDIACGFGSTVQAAFGIMFGMRPDS